MSEVVNPIATPLDTTSPVKPSQPEADKDEVPGKRTSDETLVSDDAKKPKLDTDVWTKKRKVALLMAYSGQGYLGMQRNPGTHTIEEDLFQAMLRSGLISEENYNAPQQIQFQRAARTDKNVSAARQVVSLKMPAEGPVLERLNEELPPGIRALGLCRVTKNFNSKSNCDARTYSYTLPTLALAPADQPDVGEEYRVTPEVMQRAAETLTLFQGTHNFHNFTSRKHWQDPSAKRYIMKMECGAPFVTDGLEFTEVRVKGQSFMLHQIRKMVGVAIAVVKGFTSADVIERAWQQERLDLPVAPGLGLVLEEADCFTRVSSSCVHYDKYNRKYGGDGLHETLTWAGTEEAVQKFKQDYIWPTIVRGEREDKSMIDWLRTLPLHSYAVRERPHVSEAKLLAEQSGDISETKLPADQSVDAEEDEENDDVHEKSQVKS
ncbi:hypothetical protein B566_EDAN012234 [Ephemera danica]|nr:hypothetical protein B566_EDAN012234 [Ephemera danica]